ncbi:nucleoside monophosphate kinase [Roseiconus lacunae]|uniref:Adenylate kinase n=1 Tax=Roseiconus lacunae TaxID=2605694 RepID=A0ABT7PG72_9BACT|nr:nucleoside monophosphate kinase [Roseiconus lacunae]MCD0460568.1 nucleoside monophosphate kinase [Roseiconus lacunae]MDM4015383.1 nucleoside monophosphate kinase [Roseiconus lacunae]
MNRAPEPERKQLPPDDLEVKDAQLIFNSVWKQLETERGHLNLRFPTELILLGGAPGAGKGTNTDFIREVRDISAQPIVVSELLSTPEAQRIKAQGGMVGDREVVSLIFNKLLEPQFQNGAILDGFPRTKVQVECLKMLYDRMKALRRELIDNPHLEQMKPPVFHIMVLFVDESESIRRQLMRGRQVIAHNEEVSRSGIGELWEERATDFNEELARNRYRVFKEKTYDALVSLKQLFHFHFINAQADLVIVQENILNELEYQSSLELDPRTFHTIGDIPLASHIVQHARRDLVRRLDSYEYDHPETFHRIVKLIESKFIPIVLRHAISGRATISSEDEILEDPLALQMLIDVFSERGYHAVIDIRRRTIPERFDLQTGKIYCEQIKVYRIAVFFKGSEIRRG